MPISPSDSNLTKAASVSTLMSLNSEADDKSIDIEMVRICYWIFNHV